MKAIQKGDRGAAVEDIQRRLLALGHNLGSSGVDGVFLDDTRRAVEEFQENLRLPVTGVVDDRSWSTLVDSTFAFGDRLLYLRAPFFHGKDVFELQTALNALGFTCGARDGIFGSYTERAVAEFQTNSGLDADGVVGATTFEALLLLHHMWSDKSGISHSQASSGPRKRTGALGAYTLELEPKGAAEMRVARRVANLAAATDASAQVRITGENGDALAYQEQLFASVKRPVLHLAVELSDTALELSGDFSVSLPIPHNFTMRPSHQQFQHLATLVLDAVEQFFG